jgi:hypothetical protein
VKEETKRKINARERKQNRSDKQIADNGMKIRYASGSVRSMEGSS